MLKRAADWLEKMSAGALLVGLFQQESLTALLFGAACLLGCFCITLVLQEEKTVMAWIFVGGVCFLVFVSAFSVALYQTFHKKQEAAQPEPAVEEPLAPRPERHADSPALSLEGGVLDSIKKIGEKTKNWEKNPWEKVFYAYNRDANREPVVSVFCDDRFPSALMVRHAILDGLRRDPLECKIKAVDSMDFWRPVAHGQEVFKVLYPYAMRRHGCESGRMSRWPRRVEEKASRGDEFFAKANA